MRGTDFGFEPNPERTKPKTTRPRVEEPESTCIEPRRKTMFTKTAINNSYKFECVPMPIILFIIGIFLGGTMLGIGFGIASMTHSCPNVVCCTNSSSPVCGNGILENEEECDYGDHYGDSHSTNMCVNCKLVPSPSYHSPPSPPRYD